MCHPDAAVDLGRSIGQSSVGARNVRWKEALPSTALRRYLDAILERSQRVATPTWNAGQSGARPVPTADAHVRASSLLATLPGSPRQALPIRRSASRERLVSPIDRQGALLDLRGLPGS